MTKVRVFYLILGVLVLSGCENQDSASDAKFKTATPDVKEEVQEAVDAVGQATENKMVEYQQSLESKLDALDEKHEELEAKVKDAGKEAKNELQETLAELKSKKETVKTKLDNLGTSTGKAWREMRTGIENALEDLGEGYDRALKEYPK